jgi:hypothetical protein
MGAHLIHLVVPIAQDRVVHLPDEVDKVVVEEIVVAVDDALVRLHVPDRHVGRRLCGAVQHTP